jgi:hypothetical protein
MGAARELVKPILKSKRIWEEILDKPSLETALSSPMLTTLAISNYRSLRELPELSLDCSLFLDIHNGVDYYTWSAGALLPLFFLIKPFRGLLAQNTKNRIL